MNGVGKSGAILIIIDSAFMIIFGFIFTIFGSVAIEVSFSALLFLGLINLVFGIINVILAAINLAGKKNLIIPLGIIALVSVLFAWFALFFPLILLLIGGILVLCGKDNKKEISDGEIKASVAKGVEIP